MRKFPFILSGVCKSKDTAAKDEVALSTGSKGIENGSHL